MLIAFTEPSSGQRIEENESRNVDWSFRREASNLCPCHLPIGQLRNIVSLLKNKILKKYMKRCDVWNSESDSCPPLFAYQSKNSNRVSILSYPPMYQHQAIQLPPVKPGSTSSFLDLSCGVAKQKSKKKKGENGRMASQSPAVLSGSSPGFSTSPRLCRAMENAVRLLPRSSLFWDPWNSRHLQLGRGSLFLDTPANLWLGYTSHSDSLHHFYPLLSMPYPWWKMM